MTNCSSPDIAYDVGRLSRYTHNPSVEYWDAISILLGYLNGASYLFWSYYGYPVVLERSCDANWISNVDYVKPTSGYVFTLGRGLSPGSHPRRLV